jgi:hypothetical protein
MRRLALLVLLAPVAAFAQVRPPTRPPVRPLPRPAPTAPVAPAVVPAVLKVPMASISGTAIDSLTQAPLANAMVQFVRKDDPTTVRSVVTDSAGRYAVDSVALGSWLVGVLHQEFDRLGLEGRLIQLDVTESGAVNLPLGTPSIAGLLAARCPTLGTGVAANAGTGTGAFIGQVRHAQGLPLTGAARVRVQYVEVAVSNSGVQRRFPARFIDAEPSGAFAACGIPPNTVITTRAFAGGDSSGTVELLVPASGVLVRDLLVAQPKRITEAPKNPTDRPRTTLAGTARLRGIIRDTIGKPVPNARIAMSGSDAESGTSQAGTFSMGNLPSGTWMLEARAVGYQPQRFVVDLRDSVETSTEVGLFALAPTVDTVRVRADKFDSQMAGFEQRKKMGLGGHFFDEQRIADRRAIRMSDLLRATPGVSVQQGQNGRDGIRLRGTGGSGQCVPNVFLNGMYVPVDNGVIEDLVRPDEVRAMEVYPGTGSLPVEFQRPNGCGAIVIWLGPKRAPGR